MEKYFVAAVQGGHVVARNMAMGNPVVVSDHATRDSAESSARLLNRVDAANSRYDNLFGRCDTLGSNLPTVRRRICDLRDVAAIVHPCGSCRFASVLPQSLPCVECVRGEHWEAA